MKRTWHIILLAVLLVQSALSCKRDSIIPADSTQLMVSLYIPGSVMTRAETGPVSPLEEELKITSLQIWVFISDEGGPMDGTLVSYKRFSVNLPQTGIPNSSITRFGLDLSESMFKLLASNNAPKVDVYAVANASSAVTTVPQEGTSRDVLDQLVVDKIGGNYPLTMAVPAAGLPMSGVLKGVTVSGGYPVLSIPNYHLKLTRAVSKIRFVFSQQGIPASGDTPAVIANDACEIVSIEFDGTSGGKDCQISSSERLFTDKAIDLGDQPEYVALSTSISNHDGEPIIPNDKLSIVEDPESLFFRGAGNGSETPENYEIRLDAAVSAESQVGPIYLRETNKRISGKIYYRTIPGEGVQVANFSMDPKDVFSRNHTWIVYACFVEETMKLKLTVSVDPWDWESYSFDFTEGSVNVVRRFTVFETPTPTFKKKEMDGFYDIRFWHTLTIDELEVENVVEGDIIIAAPVGGSLIAIPVPGKDPGMLEDAFLVEVVGGGEIYPNYGKENERMEDCLIRIHVRANTAKYTDAQLEGQYMDLHLGVKMPNDNRYVDLGSESIDYYRFILDPQWDQ